MEKKLEIGSAVEFIDAHRKAHPALITKVWGPSVGGQPGCNLVFVVDDPSKEDNYGRQIERQTSVVHLSGQPAKANCWCWPDEVPSGE